MATLWNFLNGKKTIIGLIAKALTSVIADWKPEMAGLMETLNGYIDIWIIGAVAHKIEKKT